eukprot:2421199-Ditylum_brightwellii.AAC.1
MSCRGSTAFDMGKRKRVGQSNPLPRKKTVKDLACEGKQKQEEHQRKRMGIGGNNNGKGETVAMLFC